MTDELTIYTATAEALIPADADKDGRYRLGAYVAWLKAEGLPWYEPDLARYRDALLSRGLARSTVAAHLSTIRGRYDRLARDNEARDALELAIRGALQDQGERATAADVEALVSRALARMQNGADPKASAVKVTTRQDRPDDDGLRLTGAQASALLAAPGVDTLAGLRDTALIGLMLCTGIREAELCALRVEDLRQRLGGELALHVRRGKGAKERLIPYGELCWVLIVVDAWRKAAGIESGPVFRGFRRDAETLRPGGLSVRSVQYIAAAYKAVVDGDLVTVHPHDLRRTYASLLYKAGVDLVAIQQNLGHANLKTTLTYIGALDAGKRRAPALYSFDTRALERVPEPL